MTKLVATIHCCRCYIVTKLTPHTHTHTRAHSLSRALTQSLSQSDDGMIVGSFSLRATENAKFVIRNVATLSLSACVVSMCEG
jgi:hypothetical protein